MPTEDNKESRLSRWSKRKLAVAEEEKAEAPVATDTELEERAAQLVANREAAEAVDLEALDGDSDFSIFMKEGVPDVLKRKALATLWRSNPVLANVDGLVDYDDDFANPDLIMKTFKSAYQAGRGYLEHVERLAKLEQAEGEATEVDVTDDEEPEEVEVLDEENAEAPADVAADAPSLEDDPAEIIEEDLPQPKVSLRSRLELNEEA